MRFRAERLAEQSMISNAKLAKRPETDRISDLPDSVLCHILSFLPTKFAVATGILSTRWKTLWTSLPTLDFRDSAIFGAGIDFRNPREMLKFTNFVDRVLMLRNNSLNLDSFRLHCGGNCDQTRVSEWACFAIAQNAREIELTLSLRELFELPTSFFVSERLKVLRLKCRIFIDVPHSVSFPNLKALQFHCVKFSTYTSLEKIICGCPVLEDLDVRNCKWLQGYSLNVSGLALKNLTLHLPTYLTQDCEYKIAVDAPILESLNIKDQKTEIFSMNNLSSLVKANVNVAKRSDPSITNDEYGNHVYELLQGISNVKILSISGETMEALFYGYDHSFPKFHNMTRLELGLDDWNGWTLLPNLLSCSPNLEDLVFAEGLIPHLQFQLGVFRFNWNPPEHVPQCLSLHLKAIEIRYFTGEPYELQLIKYLLKNAKVLNKMSFECCFFQKEKKILKKDEKGSCQFRAAKSGNAMGLLKEFQRTCTGWVSQPRFGG